MRSPFIEPLEASDATMPLELNLANALLDPEEVREEKKGTGRGTERGEGTGTERGAEEVEEAFWFPLPGFGELKMDGYEDPALSGVPLKEVKDRKEVLSKNFTVGEFARAQEGRYTWKYYRADPALISELQVLRDVLGKPVTIIDGYYPPVYQKNVLKVKEPEKNPHFSGRAVKIRVEGMTGKSIAENIISYCDKNLAISVGEQSVSIYIAQQMPRISSYILNAEKKAQVIKDLQRLDEDVKKSTIIVLSDAEIPDALIALSNPVNDPRLTATILRETEMQYNEALQVLDKFLTGKSDTDKVATLFKSTKNITKLGDDIAKIQGGKKLSELLSKDRAGLDFLSRLQLLKSTLGLLGSFTKLTTISEKKEKYHEFLKNNSAADLYLTLDITDGIISMTADTINLGFGLACLTASDTAVKTQILETAAEFEKAVKAATLIIEGAKILRSVTNIIIAISRGDYSAVKDNLVDIGKSILTILTLVKYGGGIVSAITGAYLFYKFVFVYLPTLVGDNVRAIAMGSTITAMRELDAEFRRVTKFYLYAKYDFERITTQVGYSDEDVAAQSQLQRTLYDRYAVLFRYIDDFRKYVEQLYTSTRSTTNLYSSFEAIPRRIFANREKLQPVWIMLENFPKSYRDFSLEQAMALNDYYDFFYEGIVKCHLEVQKIYEERVQVGWGNDPYGHEVNEETEYELAVEENELPVAISNSVQADLAVQFAKQPVDARTFLTVAKNLKATAANTNAVKRSGMGLPALLSAIGNYIDIAAIRQGLTDYNNLHPGKGYNMSATDVDAVFTEALHQFQLHAFLDPAEHDGLLGPTALDSLGFVIHGLKKAPDSKNFYGQAQLRNSALKKLLKNAGAVDYSDNNWYAFLMRPSFLGLRIKDGVHVLLLRQLRIAENWLTQQPGFSKMTPAQLGKALGFTKNTGYSAARLGPSKQAMHAFGLAIDINAWGNPWIGAGWVVHEENTRMLDALKKAASDPALPGRTVFAWLDSVAKNKGENTALAYTELKEKSDAFVSWLKLNPTELAFWKNSLTFDKRDPLDGFLNLHPDLVFALRQVAGLAWGAIDFGPNASGDIMHFDLRTISPGTIICKFIGGFVPQRGHPLFLTKKEKEEETSAGDETDMSMYHEAIEEALTGSYESTDGEIMESESALDGPGEAELMDDEDTVSGPWYHAIVLNRNYAMQLGWDKYSDQVNDLLLPFSGLSNVSLGEEAFAQALAAWQSAKGFSKKDSDGILGPLTWRIMRTYLSGITPAAPAVVVSGSAQEEWDNSSVIRGRYPDIHKYEKIRNAVISWGISQPAPYIESAITEWDAHPAVQAHFGSFDGGTKTYWNNAYLNLRRLYQKKGINNAAQYFADNIVDVTFFSKRTPCHRDLRDPLQKAEAALRAGGNIFQLDDAWSFVPRTFNDNINMLSQHAMGKAIDINYKTNPHITSKDDLHIINLVCASLLPSGIEKTTSPDTLQSASRHFQSDYATWASSQTDKNILAIISKRKSQLQSYAASGFMNLSPILVRALQAQGLGWGGTWISAKDFMHFEID